MVLASRLAYLVLALFLFGVFGPDLEHAKDWNSGIASAQPALDAQEAADRALIESHPVCIGSRVWSAGDMADTVFYRYRREGDHLVVGYFSHWTTERPWGKNALTASVLPALAVDAFYSHSLFVLPGVRDYLYGPGDVEGASITYRITPEGALVPLGGHADDDGHHPIALSAADVDAHGRTALVTQVWSHQLGAKRAAEFLESSESEGAMRCYSGASLRPLNDRVAETFRLGTGETPKRAKPAWRLEAAPGLR